MLDLCKSLLSIYGRLSLASCLKVFLHEIIKSFLSEVFFYFDELSLINVDNNGTSHFEWCTFLGQVNILQLFDLIIKNVSHNTNHRGERSIQIVYQECWKTGHEEHEPGEISLVEHQIS